MVLADNSLCCLSTDEDNENKTTAFTGYGKILDKLNKIRHPILFLKG